jgi:hypothetical protein
VASTDRVRSKRSANRPDPEALNTTFTPTPLEPKIRNPQARGVVADDALYILGKTIGSLCVDVERQRDRGAARAVQFAQDRLSDIADLRC